MNISRVKEWLRLFVCDILLPFIRVAYFISCFDLLSAGIADSDCDRTSDVVPRQIETFKVWLPRPLFLVFLANLTFHLFCPFCGSMPFPRNPSEKPRGCIALPW